MRVYADVCVYMQCMWRSVLHCVAACWSALHCVAVCCSVLQSGAYLRQFWHNFRTEAHIALFRHFCDLATSFIFNCHNHVIS